MTINKAYRVLKEKPQGRIEWMIDKIRKSYPHLYVEAGSDYVRKIVTDLVMRKAKVKSF